MRNLESCGMFFQKTLCLLNPQMNPWAQSKIFSSNETSTKQSSARVQFENVLDQEFSSLQLTNKDIQKHPYKLIQIDTKQKLPKKFKPSNSHT